MSDWKNVQYKDGKCRTSNGGGGGASALTDLTDVNVSSPSDGQVLKYDSTTQKWKNENESGGGGTGGHNYSTTEQVVGTWIDGKPIYEIVYTGLSMSNPGGWITPNVSLYPDTCIGGTAIDSFNQCHIMDVGKDSNGHVTVRFPVTGNTMATLVFQYTKTTD